MQTDGIVNDMFYFRKKVILLYFSKNGFGLT